MVYKTYYRSRIILFNTIDYCKYIKSKIFFSSQVAPKIYIFYDKEKCEQQLQLYKPMKY